MLICKSFGINEIIKSLLFVFLHFVTYQKLKVSSYSIKIVETIVLGNMVEEINFTRFSEHGIFSMADFNALKYMPLKFIRTAGKVK